MIDRVSSPIALSSLLGMQRAEMQLNTAAQKVAQMPAAAAGAGQNPDTVDLSAEMIAILSARDNFMANVEAARTSDGMQRALLNLID